MIPLCIIYKITFINDPHASSVRNDFSWNVGRKTKRLSQVLKFNCNNCSKSFREKHTLINHQGVHYKMSYSSCKCNKVLYSMQSFKSHLSVHRTGEHMCQQCKKIFSLKSTLTNHLHVHNNNTDMCTTCTKRFHS